MKGHLIHNLDPEDEFIASCRAALKKLPPTHWRAIRLCQWLIEILIPFDRPGAFELVGNLIRAYATLLPPLSTCKFYPLFRYTQIAALSGRGDPGGGGGGGGDSGDAGSTSKRILLIKASIVAELRQIEPAFDQLQSVYKMDFVGEALSRIKNWP